ncbi:hypothetical protein RLIN73S_06838 [Rhodanobacter lindaniclasticus]
MNATHHSVAELAERFGLDVRGDGTRVGGRARSAAPA